MHHESGELNADCTESCKKKNGFLPSFSQLGGVRSQLVMDALL
jgi:hypothetical protein